MRDAQYTTQPQPCWHTPSWIVLLMRPVCALADALYLCPGNRALSVPWLTRPIRALAIAPYLCTG